MNLVGLARAPSRLRSRAIALALTLMGVSSCTFENPGISPPDGKLAYPLAMALSPAPADADGGATKPKYLYVVNTNFDLRYNGASVQSYNLEELERQLKDDGEGGSCLELREQADAVPDAAVVSDAGQDAGIDADDAGELDAADDADLDGAALDADDTAPDADADAATDAAAVDARIAAVDAGIPPDAGDTFGIRGRLCDGRRSGLDSEEQVGRCCFRDPKKQSLLESEVTIDSFASGLTAFSDGEVEFLYVPVRSRNRLLFLKTDGDGKLSCGEGDGRCYRGGSGLKTKTLVNPDEYFEEKPAAVTSGFFGDVGLVDSRVDRQYRGFVAVGHDTGGLSLFGISQSGRPTLFDVTLGTSSRVVSLHVDPITQFIYAGAVASSSIERVGVRKGPVSDLPIPYRADSLAMNGLTGTGDVRDVLVDSRPSAEGQPLRAYALARGAGGTYLQSVAFLELDARTGDGRFARAVDAVRVGIGASKLAQVDIGDRHLLFASCYDAGEIHIIDADRRQTVSVIRDVLGPFDMQIDTARQLMYVTDFRTSSLRVVDLTPLYQHSSRPPYVVATLGVPTTPGTIR